MIKLRLKYLKTQISICYKTLIYVQSNRKKVFFIPLAEKEILYDNACIELFYSVLKKKEDNHHKYYNFKIARKAILEYIEFWYNHKRIHSAIHYITPQAAHESV